MTCCWTLDKAEMVAAWMSGAGPFLPSAGPVWMAAGGGIRQSPLITRL
ncbi:MAG: hypothetical protein LBP92_13755 [Deltaproteobacteria bacterium]|nr:hypothetical protein [Deltaproteobacteria bacterium]